MAGFPVNGGDILYVRPYAFEYSSFDIVIESGRAGFDLKAYTDEAKTIEINGTMLNDGRSGTLYLEWIPVSDDPSDDPSGGVNIGIVIGGIVAVIALAGAGVFLFMRLKD